MVSDENLAQIRALMMEVVAEMLEAYGLKRAPSANAIRQRRFREKGVTKALRGKSQNVTSKGAKRYKSVTPDVTERHQEAVNVLDFLNHEAHRKFPPVQSNLELIIARLNEGYTEVQLRQIVVRKCREWGSDPKMQPYLRPKTVFNRTNAGNYAGDLVVPHD